MPAPKRNGVIVWRIIGGAAVVALMFILGFGLNNQIALANHNSAEGPHGKLNTDIATIKADVSWIRKQLETQHDEN